MCRHAGVSPLGFKLNFPMPTAQFVRIMPRKKPTERSQEVPADYHLTCWYLNIRRIVELVGPGNVTPELRQISTMANISDGLRASLTVSALSNLITDWLHAANPATLGQLLIEDNHRSGILFTHYDRYFCEGLPKIRELLHKGHSPVPLAEAYAKLDNFQPGLSVKFRFHHEHLTSNSSWSELSGQRRLLVLGAVTEITDTTIEAIPGMMADPLVDLLEPHSLIGAQWRNRLEIHAEQIDNFALIRDVPPPASKKELDVLRNIPEQEVKQAIAEIINEQNIPKDWGGEKSDLFSSWVSIDGIRTSTAFAFKGPAKFHPMTMADLGKNGDQINRLYSEPAELLVLQHCHEITAPVRDTMRAFAQRMDDLRLFCLINGYDTLRLLKAYGKCGLQA